jgi:hypothetical protein
MTKSYLTFKLHDTPNLLTHIYSVWSGPTGDDFLGTIRWRSGWRRYVFMPYDGTTFDAACLTELITFITGLMNERLVVKV